MVHAGLGQCADAMGYILPYIARVLFGLIYRMQHKINTPPPPPRIRVDFLHNGEGANIKRYVHQWKYLDEILRKKYQGVCC